jgi:hypothetical protein
VINPEQEAHSVASQKLCGAPDGMNRRVQKARTLHYTLDLNEPRTYKSGSRYPLVVSPQGRIPSPKPGRAPVATAPAKNGSRNRKQRFPRRIEKKRKK